MPALAVDWKALLETVIASFAAGVGVTIIFSLAILGAARFADARRDGRGALATAAAGLMVLALTGSAATIAFGLVVMTSK